MWPSRKSSLKRKIVEVRRPVSGNFDGSRGKSPETAELLLKIKGLHSTYLFPQQLCCHPISKLTLL